ncbi:MAG: hypothetical protein V4555_17295 [Acidobacteriota bacterium]
MSDRSSRVLRSAGRVVGLLAVIYAGLWVVGLPLMHVLTWYEARNLVAGEPAVRLRIEPLPDVSRADLGDGATVTKLGYSIWFPWKTVSKQQDFKQGSSIAFVHGGGALLLEWGHSLDPRPRKEEHPEVEAMSRKMLGDGVMSSEYSFVDRAMQAQPEDVSLWHSRARNGIDTMLLVDKMGTMHSKVANLYRIAGGHMRGFEMTPVAGSRGPIQLELFDEKDQRIELMLQQPKAVEDGTWTQAEVNAVVASIVPPE